ncbi:MAG: hypothetical protein KGM15_02960 [Pseudomonadota bacterium]|nr:hypothetical protein [Pseudomonadota bacterium]
MRYALAVLLAAATPAPTRWTFCVAESGHEIWITDVFAAAQPRQQLEAAFAAALRARGVARPDAQCPAPLDDKTEAVNAQFTAVEFHRKLGDALHVAPPPLRR